MVWQKSTTRDIEINVHCIFLQTKTQTDEKLLNTKINSKLTWAKETQQVWHANLA